MVIKEELHKMAVELERNDVSHIDIAGFTVTIKLCDETNRVFLSTPVYFGGNFIPLSVRQSISERPHFSNGALQTLFLVDEDQFRIDLHYKGDVECIDSEKFITLLDEYGWLAEKWRDLLDEHDKNDLVHVHA